MGRRAKPTHLKLVENSRDRRPQALRAGEPQPDKALAAPPAWLTADQRAVWIYAVANAPYGLLRALDLDLMISWCIAVDLRNQAAQKLANSPLLIRTNNQNVVLSPYQRMFNQQTAILKSLAAEFGFSPAARTGIALAEEQEEHPTDRFFK